MVASGGTIMASKHGGMEKRRPHVEYRQRQRRREAREETMAALSTEHQTGII